VLAIGMLLFAGPPAQAHSELERSEPADGAMVSEGWSSVSMWFTEPIDPATSVFQLRADDGSLLDVRVTKVDGGYVELSTPSLERSTYELQWEVLSDEDGHPEGGSIVFGVGIRPGTNAA